MNEFRWQGKICVSGRACTLGRLFTSVGKKWLFARKGTADCFVGISFLTVIINYFQSKCSTKEANAALFAV